MEEVCVTFRSECSMKLGLATTFQFLGNWATAGFYAIKQGLNTFCWVADASNARVAYFYFTWEETNGFPALSEVIPSNTDAEMFCTDTAGTPDMLLSDAAKRACNENSNRVREYTRGLGMSDRAAAPRRPLTLHAPS